MEGTLGNSCMAKKSGIFNIYTENPEMCQLLILLNEEDKLIGRALIWKLKSLNIHKSDEEVIFMDRQYSILESDVEKFRNYAKEKGWSYKCYNNHHSFGTINYKGEDKNVSMTIEVKQKEIILNQDKYLNRGFCDAYCYELKHGHEIFNFIFYFSIINPHFIRISKLFISISVLMLPLPSNINFAFLFDNIIILAAFNSV
jgi:hypothetical protein